MTCVVVNDASCLIDLKKGELLHVLLRLPYRFIVPLPIREEELLDFTAQEWRMLEDGGLATYDLPGEEVAQVLGHVDKWRSQRRIEVMSMKPKKLSAVLS